MADLVAVVDTPSIQRYVFGTDNLTEIRGGSALLDTLNRFKTEKVLRTEKVYANGGSGQFIFRGTAQDEAEARLQAAVRHYTRRTYGGASLAYGLAKLTEDYPKSVRNAFDDLRTRRELAPIRPATLVLPLVKECESCSERPATGYYLRPDPSWLCEVCIGKREVAYCSRRTGVWKEFEEALKRGAVERPQTFDEIGDHIAVVYADGNGIGRWIKTIQSTEDFRSFANTVDKSIREACFSALGQIYPDARVLADILLIGGDDLVVVIEAHQALAFAYEMGQRFERATQSGLQRLHAATGEGLTLSVGIAVGKSHHPFRSLLATAEQLLQSAKRAGAVRSRGAPTMIDFHEINAANTLDLEQIRLDEYELTDAAGSRHYRTRRPYTLSDLAALLDIGSKLKQARFPRSRLNSLYEAVFEPSPERVCLRTIEVFTRGREETRKVLAETLHAAGCFLHMPWSCEARDTIISELVEFYDYLPDIWPQRTEGS